MASMLSAQGTRRHFAKRSRRRSVGSAKLRKSRRKPRRRVNAACVVRRTGIVALRRKSAVVRSGVRQHRLCGRLRGLHCGSFL